MYDDHPEKLQKFYKNNFQKGVSDQKCTEKG